VSTSVSVIIPSYNSARTLNLVLRAVRAQTYAPLEVLVVDDHSTDGSDALAASLGARVLRTPANGGCGAARNLGAAHARGNVLFFLDADVAPRPDAVANAVAALAADPRLGAVCGVEDPVPLIRDSRFEEYRSLQYHYWSISSGGRISFLFPNICAIPAPVFAEIGPFNPHLRQTEEVDYGHRLRQRYELLLSPAVRGRHDHDDRLGVLLRKLFARGRLRVPLYARSRRFARGFETPARAVASLAALGALVSVALPLVLGVPWWLAPGALVATSVACDAGMYRYVLERRGPAFTAYFAAVHYLVNLTIAAAAAVGALQWLCSGAFRRLYDAPESVTVGPA